MDQRGTVGDNPFSGGEKEFIQHVGYGTPDGRTSARKNAQKRRAINHGEEKNDHFYHLFENVGS